METGEGEVRERVCRGCTRSPDQSTQSLSGFQEYYSIKLLEANQPISQSATGWTNRVIL